MIGRRWQTMVIEFLKASFTGQLSTFQSASGTFFSFKRPLPRVEKGRFYVIQWNEKNKTIRLIPIVMPPGEIAR